tara:strand:- start:2929 stop:3480 length:552 start_codon:yes stop_codon:yes gene_type:complete
MSRIGKNPVEIPAGVTVQTNGNLVQVRGPKGELEQKIHPDLELNIEEKQLILNRPSDSKEHKSAHGLYRSLLRNMIEGVSKGFQIQQELVGVGYKASNQGQILEMNLGYSHNIFLQVPKEVKITTETVKGKNPTITLQSHDKQLIGQVASKIRSLRKPEPYKGKGVKFVGEVLRRKEGKTAAK